MWISLLEIACRILDDYHVPFDEWSLGGGTVLAMLYGHRISKDIDIFISNAQYLTGLSPRLNRLSSQQCQDYVEASNYVKLLRPEGEIDFIVSPHLTSQPFQQQELIGRCVQVETVAEIITKKLFYRAESLIVRDVVDTAVVYRNDPAALLQEAQILENSYPIIIERWKRVQPTYRDEVAQLNLLDRSLLEGDILFDHYLQALGAALKSG